MIAKSSEPISRSPDGFGLASGILAQLSQLLRQILPAHLLISLSPTSLRNQVSLRLIV
jgi:hypothetical protein